MKVQFPSVKKATCLRKPGQPFVTLERYDWELEIAGEQNNCEQVAARIQKMLDTFTKVVLTPSNYYAPHWEIARANKVNTFADPKTSSFWVYAFGTDSSAQCDAVVALMEEAVKKMKESIVKVVKL
jgi:hypothetical protein